MLSKQKCLLSQLDPKEEEVAFTFNTIIVKATDFLLSQQEIFDNYNNSRLFFRITLFGRRKSDNNNRLVTLNFNVCAQLHRYKSLTSF